MAYVQDEENQKAGAGGQVLAGSGGAATGSKQAAGTGFTNLQKYLSANAGQGGGIAGDITSQGQKAVDTARGTADQTANAWADSGSQAADSGAQAASTVYDNATAKLKADPYADISGTLGTTYGGPQSAQDFKSDSGYGVNDLDKAYQNVKNTATGFANDRATQQAGLQQKYGYGSGFAALDTFLGRQDGRDQINNWANNVNTGSAQGAIDRVNTAISGGKQKVDTARTAFEQANRDAKKARSNTPQNPVTTATGTGIADQVVDEFGNPKDMGSRRPNDKTGAFNLTRG